MLRVIVRLIPPAMHRALLRVAYRVRHHWRRWRKAPITGCNVVITDLKGDILMLRHSYGPPAWNLPGGGVGRGEDPVKAAAREVHEELGISGGTFRPLGELTGDLSGSPHVVHLFLLVSDKHPQPDNREVVEARFFPPHSLPEPMSEVTRQLLALWRNNTRQTG